MEAKRTEHIVCEDKTVIIKFDDYKDIRYYRYTACEVSR